MNEDGVSEVIGTVLLVGITVAVASVFGLILLNQEGPSDHHYAQVSYQLLPGPDQTWGTGDEQLQMRHMGGEPFARGDSKILISQGGSQTELSDTLLTGSFADGEFSIGEVWTYTLTAEPDEDLEIRTVVPRQLHSFWTNGAPAATACDTDTTDPVIGSITITPADIDTDTVGSILVEATVSDNCGLSSVDLTYDAGAPTTIPMSLSGTWQATVPDLGWASLGGGTLTLTVDAEDTSGNTANSNLVEPIEQVGATFAFQDSNCDGVWQPGEADATSDFSDGAHDEEACFVFPAAWGNQVRDKWDIHVDQLVLQIDLTSTDDEIDIHVAAPLQMAGVTLNADERIHIRSPGINAVGATFTGDRVEIRNEGAGDFLLSDTTYTSSANQDVVLRNDAGFIDATNAVLTSDDDISVRASGNVLLVGSTMTADDNILIRSNADVDLEDADHTAADNLVFNVALLSTVNVENYCGHDQNELFPAVLLKTGNERAGCGEVIP